MGKDSARIFRVSHWAIMRRVLLFDLEHLSLSSTRTDEGIDSIIHNFVAGQWVNHRRNLSTRTLAKKKAYQGEPGLGKLRGTQFWGGVM